MEKRRGKGTFQVPDVVPGVILVGSVTRLAKSTWFQSRFGEADNPISFN